MIEGATEQLQYQVVAIDTNDRRSPTATINLDLTRILTHCSFDVDNADFSDESSDHPILNANTRTDTRVDGRFPKTQLQIHVT